MGIFFFVVVHDAIGEAADYIKDRLYAVIAVIEICVISAVDEVCEHHSVLHRGNSLRLGSFDNIVQFFLQQCHKTAAPAPLEQNFYQSLVGDKRFTQFCHENSGISQYLLRMSDTGHA